MSALTDVIEAAILFDVNSHQELIPDRDFTFSLFDSFKIFQFSSISNEIMRINSTIVQESLDMDIFVYSINTQVELAIVGTFNQKNLNNLVLNFSINPGEYFIVFYSKLSIQQVLINSIFTFNFDGIIFPEFISSFGNTMELDKLESNFINEFATGSEYFLVAGRIPDGLFFRNDGIIEGVITELIECEDVIEFEFYVLVIHATEVVGGIFKICVYNDWSIERDVVLDTGLLFSELQIIEELQIIPNIEELLSSGICDSKTTERVFDMIVSSCSIPDSILKKDILLKPTICEIQKSARQFKMEIEECIKSDIPIFEFKQPDVCKIDEARTFEISTNSESENLENLENGVKREFVSVSKTEKLISDVFCF